jgi:predicted O-methyltransferase YrrM
MKRYGLGALVLCAVVVGGLCLSVHSQEKAETKMSDAAREEFIRSFRRTGLATTPEDAMLLRILVQSRGAKRGIEVGTERGFGAINMGMGFARTGGHLYTLEISPRVAKIARENIRKMQLAKTVTVIEGDALKTLPKLEGEFDFMFIDARKSDTLKYLQCVEKKLKAGTVIVVDNAIRSARSMKDFLDYMTESSDYEMVVVRASDEKRDGMAVCYKIR